MINFRNTVLACAASFLTITLLAFAPKANAQAPPDPSNPYDLTGQCQNSMLDYYIGVEGSLAGSAQDSDIANTMYAWFEDSVDIIGGISGGYYQYYSSNAAYCLEGYFEDSIGGSAYTLINNYASWGLITTMQATYLYQISNLVDSLSAGYVDTGTFVANLAGIESDILIHEPDTMLVKPLCVLAAVRASYYYWSTQFDDPPPVHTIGQLTVAALQGAFFGAIFDSWTGLELGVGIFTYTNASCPIPTDKETAISASIIAAQTVAACARKFLPGTWVNNGNVATFGGSCSSEVSSASDTVHSRMGTYILPDSTIIKYEMAWVKLQQGGQPMFLTFADSASCSPNDYYRTIPFTSTGSDTISFSRFAFFDDANYLRPLVFDPSSEDSSVLWDYWHLGDSIYRNKEVIPLSSSFGSGSYMNFIVEVKSVSNDSLVCILDTLHCFKNADGYMRFQNFPTSINIRANVPLPGLMSGVNYYLCVARVDSIPFSSSIIGYEFLECSNNTGANLGFVLDHQVGSCVSGFKMAPTNVGIQTSLQAINLNHATLNSYTHNLIAIASSDIETSGRLEIVDVIGRVILDRPIFIKKGSESYSLPQVTLTTGNYFVSIVTYLGWSTSKLTFNQ
jgi:hypothetical protein